MLGTLCDGFAGFTSEFLNPAPPFLLQTFGVLELIILKPDYFYFSLPWVTFKRL